MAGIAGMINTAADEKFNIMKEKIAHRGKHDGKILSFPNAVYGGIWHAVETNLQNKPFGSYVVWDGFVPDELTPESIQHWNQPFALAACVNDMIFLARDPLGAKPLYYGYVDSGLVFASEVKALIPLTKKIFEFPTGTIYDSENGFKPFWKIRSGTLAYDDEEKITKELGEKLDRAIERCCLADEMGIWLSGGVDSSVIAALAVKHGKRLQSFVSGVEGAPDILYGTKVAEHLGIPHHIIKVTLEDLLALLPEVIYFLESFDALLVRSTLTNYLTSKVASDYVGTVFSGEGGDELFAGYDYIKNLALDEIPAELEDIVMRLHNTALQRVDRSSQANGLTAVTPFTDLEVVNYALQIPAKYKVFQKGEEKIEKWILRKVVDGLIPDSVLWRPKAKFWQGAGVQDLLANYSENLISDYDFHRERILSNGWMLNSKEELMYYRIFKEHLGDLEHLDWMGRTKGAPVQY